MASHITGETKWIPSCGSVSTHFLWLLVAPIPLKWCENGVKCCLKARVKGFCKPSRPPKWLIPLYSLPGLARTKIHPLTQLALQPVEWRNAATSSLCDIPHTIMYGPSSGSHAGLHTALNHMGPKWKKRASGVRGGKEKKLAKYKKKKNRKFKFTVSPCYIKLQPWPEPSLNPQQMRAREGERGYCYLQSNWRNRER